MILAAHQPQFLPWLGYFDKMARCDVFVLLDDVQYKTREWQNRNRIWSHDGGQWLTVPVVDEFRIPINAVRIDNTAPWRRKHAGAISHAYAKAGHFKEGWEPWRLMYEAEHATLLEVSLRSIEEIRKALGVTTPMTLSSSLKVEGASTERLVNLCRQLGADTYLSGAGGRDYMDLSLFERAGIKVVFQDYKHPVYAQFGDAFIPNLSAVDLLWHHGPQAPVIFRTA